MTQFSNGKPRMWGAYLLVFLWLSLTVWDLSQWQAKPSDVAWAVKLFVKDVSQVAVWTASWAWITHTLQGQTRLSTHIFIAAGASLFNLAVLSLGIPWLFFAMGWSWPQGLHKAQWIILIIFIGLLHLRAAAGQVNRHSFILWVFGSAIAASLYGLHAWAELNDQEAVKRLPYEPNIYPSGWVKAPNLDIEEGLKELWGQGWILDAH